MTKGNLGKRNRRIAIANRNNEKHLFQTQITANLLMIPYVRFTVINLRGEF